MKPQESKKNPQMPTSKWALIAKNVASYFESRSTLNDCHQTTEGYFEILARGKNRWVLKQRGVKMA